MNAIGEAGEKWIGEFCITELHLSVIDFFSQKLSTFLFQTIANNNTQIEFAFSIALSSQGECLAIGSPNDKTIHVEF